MDTATRSTFRGIHLQVMSAQASLAAIDHTLRELLSNGDGQADAPVAVPPKVTAVSDELRSLLGKPTLDEQRKAVFMPKPVPDAIPEAVASGTPSGDTPSVPSD